MPGWFGVNWFKEFVAKEAHRTKVFGGGMRQGWYYCYWQVFALDYHIDRLAEDHVKLEELNLALH